MTRSAFVHRISTRGPDDVVGLESMLASGEISAESIIAILGKTEGNGCVNDFTRGFAAAARGHGADPAIWQPTTVADAVAADPAGSYTAAAAEVIDAFASVDQLNAAFAQVKKK